MCREKKFGPQLSYYGCLRPSIMTVWLSINLFRVEYNPANTSKGNEKWLELREFMLNFNHLVNDS